MGRVKSRGVIRPKKWARKIDLVIDISDRPLTRREAQRLLYAARRHIYKMRGTGNPYQQVVGAHKDPLINKIIVSVFGISTRQSY